MAISNFAQALVLGVAIASEFGRWAFRSLNGVTAGDQNVELDYAQITLPDSSLLMPLATNAPLLIQDGTAANDETVTPSSVSAALWLPSPSFAATFANSHLGRFVISSGTYGLQEAINAMRGAGGQVLVTNDWNGTTLMITNATGATNVSVRDIRDGNEVVYSWDGSHYQAAQTLTVTS